MLRGTVVSDLGKGCWFIEQDLTRDCIFVHQRYVVGRKFLHLQDRVTFQIIPNTMKPGEVMAGDVQIVGLRVAHQASDAGVRS
jgi:hypothetical protein